MPMWHSTLPRLRRWTLSHVRTKTAKTEVVEQRGPSRHQLPPSNLITTTRNPANIA